MKIIVQKGGRPGYNEFLVLIVHHFDNRQILRLYALAFVEHIFQIAAYFVCGNAFHGTY